MKYLVTYVDDCRYDIDGEIITTSTLQAVNLSDRIDSDLNKGFQTVKFNLKKTPLTMGNFPELPGLYEMQVRRVPVGKKQTDKGFIRIPTEAKLLKKIDFPNMGDAILVLGGKKTEVKTDDGKTWRGISVYLLDPSAWATSSDGVEAKGIYAVDETLENTSLNALQKCPGWYKPVFRSTRNIKGEEMERLAKLDFVQDVKLEELLGAGAK